MKLITVDEKLVELFSKFSSEVFVDYYTPINGIESATYMANKFLSKENISRLINEGAICKLVMEDDLPMAYMEYIKEENRVFLSKYYVHKNYRGQGIGRIMFKDLIDFTKSVNLNKIYLTVNKHNPTFEIYKHLGFVVIDSVVTDIGSGYVMDDYIMELTI